MSLGGGLPHYFPHLKKFILFYSISFFMTTSQRWSTVHDLATLRLHRDGTRVKNSDSNLLSRRVKYSARDARGNWFARDAGGLGTVKRRRTITREDNNQEEEEFDLNAVSDSANEVNADKKDETGKADGTSTPPHKLRRRQLRFSEDMDFLSSAPSPNIGQALPGPNDSPVPSSVRQHFANITCTGRS